MQLVSHYIWLLWHANGNSLDYIWFCFYDFSATMISDAGQRNGLVMTGIWTFWCFLVCSWDIKGKRLFLLVFFYGSEESARGKRTGPVFAELTELLHLSLTTLEWSKKSIHGTTRSCRTAQFQLGKAQSGWVYTIRSALQRGCRCTNQSFCCVSAA